MACENAGKPQTSRRPEFGELWHFNGHNCAWVAFAVGDADETLLIIGRPKRISPGSAEIGERFFAHRGGGWHPAGKSRS